MKSENEPSEIGERTHLKPDSASHTEEVDLAAIASTIADRVRIVQPPAGWQQTGGGRDIDCIVSDVDPWWPLRLSPQWKLAQRLQYLFSRQQWWLARDDEVVVFDTTEDPHGLETGVATSKLLDPGDPLAAEAGRAVYLTEKRLFKCDLAPEKWQTIGELARDEPSAYRAAIRAMFGTRAGDLIAESTLSGSAPSKDLLDMSRRARLSRRLRHPIKSTAFGLLEAARVVRRLVRPTGLVVVVAGPDGSGKSTLAAAVIDACEDLFRRHAHFHWRPGLLPRPGTAVGRPAGDPSRPHESPARGPIASALFLGYYWADFLVGGWLKWWSIKARTGLVVVERGWWDIGIDSHRYRMSVGPAAIRFLGRFLLQPDIFLVIEAEPAVLLARKTELSAPELARQSAAWRRILPADRSTFWDASRPVPELVAGVRRMVVDRLEQAAVSGLRAGWIGASRKRTLRWSLPRGPRPAARAGLLVYQPVTVRGHAAWRAARIAAGLGVFSLVPRGDAPPREVREILAPHLPPRTTISLARANHPGRYVALLVGRDGTCRLVAKVATDRDGARALAGEASALESFGGYLRPPLSAPRIAGVDDGLLLLEPVTWRPRVRPWRLPADVAYALGSFYGAVPGGLAHGDCAPWNLLRTSNGWILVDWEAARSGAPPFFDVWHYLVQAHALLGRPSERALVDGALGRGPVGELLIAYTHGAVIDFEDARPSLTSYLETSGRMLNADRPDGRAGLNARRRLLEALES